MEVTFSIPDHMGAQFVVETMTVYLLGGRAFENPIDVLQSLERRHGPYQQGDKWQLDGSNDFWLRIEDDRGRLTCRYPSQFATIETMAALFNSRYNLDRNAIFR
jgi:hypothetical protein